MKELTKEKAVELHRKLWDEIYIFLINNKNKAYNEYNIVSLNSIMRVKRLMLKKVLYDLRQDAYDYGFIKGIMVCVLNDCFLCEYSVRKTNKNSPICALCPLYDANDINSNCLNGLYDKMFDAYTYGYLRGPVLTGNTIELAKSIRDLPVVN